METTKLELQIKQENEITRIACKVYVLNELFDKYKYDSHLSHKTTYVCQFLLNNQFMWIVNNGLQ